MRFGNKYTETTTKAANLKITLIFFLKTIGSKNMKTIRYELKSLNTSNTLIYNSSIR